MLPLAEPEDQGPIRRDILVLVIIFTILCCLFVLFIAGSYFFYTEYTQTQAADATATSAFMATKIKQDTEAQATIQAEASATAQVLSVEATATAQQLSIQATATAQARSGEATATALSRNAEIMLYQYFDPFVSNESNWREKDEENDFWNGNTKVTDGRYIWQINEAKDTFVAWADFEKAGTVQDFDAAVLARRTEGGANEHCYGMFFRKSPEGFDSGSYIFSVCENGYFAINYYDVNTSWELIQDWTETDTIYENDWNLLEVSARGSSFNLYINHQEVASFTDERLSEGVVSVFIDVYELNPGLIEFDNFGLQKR